jgi:hypothetical protein
MGCTNSKHISEEQLYYAPDGTLVAHNKNFHHSKADELDFVSGHDTVVMSGGDECYVVSSDWLQKWIGYIRNDVASPVGPITNLPLVDPINTFQVKSNIAVKKDFRPVCKSVWEYYFAAYGGGPVIMFYGEWCKT